MSIPHSWWRLTSKDKFVAGDGFVLAGAGFCRGQGWQSNGWPKVLGKKTAKDCAMACMKANGCTAFDLSNEEGDKFACHLFSHSEVIPAPFSSLKGACYILPSKQGKKQVKEDVKEVPREAIIKEAMDDINIKIGDGSITN